MFSAKSKENLENRAFLKETYRSATKFSREESTTSSEGVHKTERQGYLRSLLNGKNGEEFQFEEKRVAKKPILRGYSEQILQSGSEEVQFEEIRAAHELGITPCLSQTTVSLAPTPVAKSSPTINTKLAMKEVMSMFNQPLDFEHSLDHSSLRDATCDSIALVYQDDITMEMPRPCGISKERQPLAQRHLSKAAPQPEKKVTCGAIVRAVLDSCSEGGRKQDSSALLCKEYGGKHCMNNSVHDRIEDGSLLMLNSTATPSPIKKDWSADLYETLTVPRIPLQNSQVISSTPEPISVFSPGYHERTVAHLAGEISSCEGYNGLQDRSGPDGPTKRNKGSFCLEERTLQLCGFLGEGGYAKTWLVEDTEEENSMDCDNRLVMKVQSPPSPWEFYVSQVASSRISPAMRSSVVKVHEGYFYKDKSLILMKYYSHGSLQDLVNIYLSKGRKMEEPLVIFYTIEMLKIVEELHRAGIIHCDIKPDNFMIRDEEREGLEHWKPDHKEGWDSKGLVLIDFGRSIDTRIYPPGTMFIGSSKVETFECIEMRTGEPWSTHPDTFGLCCIVHCLLFGTYMELKQVRRNDDTVWMPKTPLKRYWEHEMWTTFFDKLINVSQPPHPSQLMDLRKDMEKILTSNTRKLQKIKPLLVKQSIMLYEAGR